MNVKKFVCVFLKFNEFITFYRVEWAPRADFLVLTMNSRVPKGQKMKANVAKTFRKTLIFSFFLLAWKMLICSFGGGKGTNFGPKMGPEGSEIAVEKLGVWQKM